MTKKTLRGPRGFALSAIGVTMMFGASMAAHADNDNPCTITNWTGQVDPNNALLASNPAAAIPNPRYAGPCSLRVDLTGDFAYLVDESPLEEPNYNMRFYFNPNDNASAGPMIIFAASDDEGEDVLQLWYNVGGVDSGGPINAPNHATLVVVTDDGAEIINAGDIGGPATGWNSFEIVWESAADATVALRVNAEDDLTLDGVDTSSIRISEALLGLAGPDEVPTSDNPFFFDDFDSRRNTRPGRLCRGLTDQSRDELLLEDAQTIFDEVSALEDFDVLAPGQPDFNEDGVVDLADAQAVFNRVSEFLGGCENNR